MSTPFLINHFGVSQYELQYRVGSNKKYTTGYDGSIGALLEQFPQFENHRKTMELLSIGNSFCYMLQDDQLVEQPCA